MVNAKKIENSFIASYDVKSTNNPTYIMNIFGNEINFSNIEIYYMNNSRIFPYIEYKDGDSILSDKNCLVSYKFSQKGINTIKVIITQALSKMNGLFDICSDLVNISFSETFDTSHVKTMDEMFGSCYSLVNVNVSSFNTNLVSSYFQMFSLGQKLTSLDLSSFEGRYSCDFIFMFMSVGNLRYIDLSSLYSVYPECNRIDLINVPPNGTVIANRNFKTIYSYNWKIMYKD